MEGMLLHFATDEFGRLIATVTHGDKSAVVTARDRGEAAADLLGALDSLASTGLGESFWPEAQGEYRWLFRRRGDTVHLVVLWCAGVVTGWEHVFEAVCDTGAFLDQAVASLRAAQAAFA